MRILVHGSAGRMGQELIKIIENGYRNSTLAGGVGRNINEFESEADCIIDFSNHESTGNLVAYAVNKKLPLVVATTGHNVEELQIIADAATQIPVFMAANMSLGIALLIELARKTVTMMPDAEIEIVERHHNRKLDAPSGTALLLADEIKDVRNDLVYNLGRRGHKKREKNEIGIHAIRMGNIVGDHEIIVGTDSQTITLRHEAHSRALFAEGAVAAAEFLIKQDAGMYTMKDMLG
ncbi:4-hydroxy-tetrahydrodipicolinate reductase [Tissierella creatinini]|nr:4-hydroxy-tetrahydrodipicolinate reductase [Tissierella creatinini]TJX63071.1 4-hydroxy-tetrahydrodipicolinate reductase [Soehngenia saccharolytica]